MSEFIPGGEGGDNTNGGEGGENPGDNTGGEGGENPGDNPSPNPDDDLDDGQWDDKTKKYIQSLRKENAKYRTTAKETADEVKSIREENAKRDKAFKAALGIEDDEMPVEDQLEATTHENQNLYFQNEVLKLAVTEGISGDGVEYFEFLIGRAVSQLDEGEELSEEEYSEIVARVKGSGGPQGGGSTSVKTQGSGNGGQVPSTGGETITVQDFVDMKFTQKGELFAKNEALYKKLNAEAMEQGLL